MRFAPNVIDASGTRIYPVGMNTIAYSIVERASLLIEKLQFAFEYR